ncbi:hypothetical protein AYI68_g1401 [Smittium mucronatum]|uniref:Uncharacterized protein n=1 Tax=Smittium mucronatum TaxID=133383 RepID=A0A1R0H5K3_9FUNG|nr:hypothetical protein AYI68_g1401 [Smittium mucronatum]
MELGSDIKEPSGPEPTILEKTFSIMERTLVLTRDSRNGGFHRLQRQSLGIAFGAQMYSVLMKLMEFQRSNRMITADILRQQDKTGVREEIWRKNFPRIAWYIGRDMYSFSKDKIPHKSNLCSTCLETSIL